MSANSEYDALVKRRDSTEARYYAAIRVREECDYHLERLRPVKERISELKNEFRFYVKQKDEQAPDELGAWVGQTCKLYESKANDVISENNYYYRSGLDAALDAINDEITRWENKWAQQVAVIGHLYSLFNSLCNEVENFFN